MSFWRNLWKIFRINHRKRLGKNLSEEYLKESQVEFPGQFLNTTPSSAGRFHRLNDHWHETTVTTGKHPVVQRRIFCLTKNFQRLERESSPYSEAFETLRRFLRKIFLKKFLKTFSKNIWRSLWRNFWNDRWRNYRKNPLETLQRNFWGIFCRISPSNFGRNPFTFLKSHRRKFLRNLRKKNLWSEGINEFLDLLIVFFSGIPRRI